MHSSVRIITHSGSFHSDDIFACATLSLVLEKEGREFEIIRSRDEEVIKTGDYVVDVGGVYDESLNRFDHHQIGGAGVRENAIPYASFGLVWKKFGKDLVGADSGSDFLDRKIVQAIDAPDNGISIVKPLFEDMFPCDFHTIVLSYLPSWKEKNEKNLHVAFLELVNLAKGILSREISKIKDNEEGIRLAQDVYKNTKDKRLIILEEPYPWKYAFQEYPEPLIVVSPKLNGQWEAETVPIKPYSFERRIQFPVPWAGFRGEELQKITKVSDATFCHFHRFLVVANSKEGVITLAKLAILA